MGTTDILAILVICLAGFMQGLSGFGFGLVAMPLLPLLMTLKQAVGLAAVLNLVVCGMTFYSNRAHYAWRQGLGLIAGSCLGVPVGVYILASASESLLLRVLGGVMVVFAVNELFLARVRRIPLPAQSGLPFGLLSGSLGGAFNMGGPPAIIYCYSQPWDREQIIATLQVVFGISALVRVTFMAGEGILTRPVLATSLVAVIPLLGAIAIGHRMFFRIPQQALKRGTFAFLAMMGIKYLLWP